MRHTCLQIELEPTPTAARRARRELDSLRCLLDPELADDVELLVSELVSNSVRHAQLRSGQPIRLHVAITGEQLRVEVGDDGWFPTIGHRTAGRESGWGFHLLSRLADRWGIDAGGETLVWFESDLGDRGLAVASGG